MDLHTSTDGDSPDNLVRCLMQIYAHKEERIERLKRHGETGSLSEAASILLLTKEIQGLTWRENAQLQKLTASKLLSFAMKMLLQCTDDKLDGEDLLSLLENNEVLTTAKKYESMKCRLISTFKCDSETYKKQITLLTVRGLRCKRATNKCITTAAKCIRDQLILTGACANSLRLKAGESTKEESSKAIFVFDCLNEISKHLRNAINIFYRSLMCELHDELCKSESTEPSAPAVSTVESSPVMDPECFEIGNAEISEPGGGNFNPATLHAHFSTRKKKNYKKPKVTRCTTPINHTTDLDGNNASFSEECYDTDADDYDVSHQVADNHDEFCSKCTVVVPGETLVICDADGCHKAFHLRCARALCGRSSLPETFLCCQRVKVLELEQKALKAEAMLKLKDLLGMENPLGYFDSFDRIMPDSKEEFLWRAFINRYSASLNIKGFPPISSKERKQHRHRLQEKLKSFGVTYHIDIVNEVGRELGYPTKVKWRPRNHACQLSKQQMEQFWEATKRSDNYSLLDIVKHPLEKVGLQLIAGSSITIVAGTIIAEYFAPLYMVSQLGKEDFKCNSLLTLLEYDATGSSIVIAPVQRGSVAKYASGLQRCEQHKANCMLFAVNDKDGRRRLFLRTLRDVEPGEHFMWYYGDDFPSDDFISLAELVRRKGEDPKKTRKRKRESSKDTPF